MKRPYPYKWRYKKKRYYSDVDSHLKNYNEWGYEVPKYSSQPFDNEQQYYAGFYSGRPANPYMPEREAYRLRYGDEVEKYYPSYDIPVEKDKVEKGVSVEDFKALQRQTNVLRKDLLNVRKFVDYKNEQGENTTIHDVIHVHLDDVNRKVDEQQKQIVGQSDKISRGVRQLRSVTNKMISLKRDSELFRRNINKRFGNLVHLVSGNRKDIDKQVIKENQDIRKLSNMLNNLKTRLDFNKIDKAAIPGFVENIMNDYTSNVSAQFKNTIEQIYDKRKKEIEQSIVDSSSKIVSKKLEDFVNDINKQTLSRYADLDEQSIKLVGKKFADFVDLVDRLLDMGNRMEVEDNNGYIAPEFVSTVNKKLQDFYNSYNRVVNTDQQLSNLQNSINDLFGTIESMKKDVGGLSETQKKKFTEIDTLVTGLSTQYNLLMNDHVGKNTISSLQGDIKLVNERLNKLDNILTDIDDKEALKQLMIDVVGDEFQKKFLETGINKGNMNFWESYRLLSEGYNRLYDSVSRTFINEFEIAGRMKRFMKELGVMSDNPIFNFETTDEYRNYMNDNRYRNMDVARNFEGMMMKFGENLKQYKQNNDLRINDEVRKVYNEIYSFINELSKGAKKVNEINDENFVNMYNKFVENVERVNRVNDGETNEDVRKSVYRNFMLLFKDLKNDYENVRKDINNAVNTNKYIKEKGYSVIKPDEERLPSISVSQNGLRNGSTVVQVDKEKDSKSVKSVKSDRKSDYVVNASKEARKEDISDDGSMVHPKDKAYMVPKAVSNVETFTGAGRKLSTNAISYIEKSLDNAMKKSERLIKAMYKDRNSKVRGVNLEKHLRDPFEFRNYNIIRRRYLDYRKNPEKYSSMSSSVLNNLERFGNVINYIDLKKLHVPDNYVTRDKYIEKEWGIGSAFKKVSRRDISGGYIPSMSAFKKVNRRNYMSAFKPAEEEKESVFRDIGTLPSAEGGREMWSSNNDRPYEIINGNIDGQEI